MVECPLCGQCRETPAKMVNHYTEHHYTLRLHDGRPLALGKAGWWCWCGTTKHEATYSVARSLADHMIEVSGSVEAHALACLLGLEDHYG